MDAVLLRSSLILLLFSSLVLFLKNFKKSKRKFFVFFVFGYPTLVSFSILCFTYLIDFNSVIGLVKSLNLLSILASFSTTAFLIYYLFKKPNTKDDGLKFKIKLYLLTVGTFSATIPVLCMTLSITLIFTGLYSRSLIISPENISSAVEWLGSGFVLAVLVSTISGLFRDVVKAGLK